MQEPFPVGNLCEAARFGSERGFSTVDTHSSSVPENNLTHGL